MEQLLYFVLGVLTVATLVGVVSMFRTAVQVKNLRDELQTIQDYVDTLAREQDHREELLNRRIDGEIDRIDRIGDKTIDYADTLNNNVHDEMNKLYAYIDSRTDKLEDRINTKFNDNTAFVDNMFHEINSIKERVLSK
jgi:sensor histidine kinase regulating citrate/malate metabolism